MVFIVKNVKFKIMSIKKDIFEVLDEKGYCMDYTIAQIYEKHGKEPNLCQAETYKTQWKRFKIDKMNFGNKEIKEKEKGS